MNKSHTETTQKKIEQIIIKNGKIHGVNKIN